MDPNFRNQAFASPQRRLEFFEPPHPQMYGYMPVQMFYHPMVVPQHHQPHPQPHPHQPHQLMFVNPYGFQGSTAIKAPSPRNHPLHRFPVTVLQQPSNSVLPDPQLPGRPLHATPHDINLSLPISKLLNRDYTAISEYKYSGSRIGVYDVASRRARINRYRQKRKELSFKQVRYQSRASICQKRERVGGRFVKTSEVIRADAATKRQRRSEKQKLERYVTSKSKESSARAAEEQGSVSSSSRSASSGSASSGGEEDKEDEEEEEEEEETQHHPLPQNRAVAIVPRVDQAVQSILTLKSRQ